MPSHPDFPHLLSETAVGNLDRMSTERAADDLLHRAMELSAIAESGLAYCRDSFDIERFHRIGAIANELMRTISTTPLAEYQREVAYSAGYATPKIDVRAGLFDESGRVLLAREIADGRWSLPGGWCDVLETPRQAVERETLEETGVPVRSLNLAAAIDRHQWPHEPVHDRHIYKLFFVCAATQPVSLDFTSKETSQIAWFDINDLPPLSTGRVLPQQITLLHQHWEEPGTAYVD